MLRRPTQPEVGSPRTLPGVNISFYNVSANQRDGDAFYMKKMRTPRKLGWVLLIGPVSSFTQLTLRGDPIAHV